MNLGMKRRGRLQILLWRLSGAVLAACCFQLQAETTASSDSFENGWTAYDQGDYEKAIQLWLPLAEQGHTSAQINLGVMYDQGYGVGQDFEQAASWYQAAARKHSPVAQYNLAMFLLQHKKRPGAEQDALEWFHKAAAQGYADAQYQLGMMYADGAAGQAGISDAPQWLYQAGLSYLSSNDKPGAHSAVSALHSIGAGHELARELETRLAAWSNASESDAGEILLSTGTAWPVAAGYAVTNHHVVAGKQSLILINNQGKKIPARVVASDHINDIALLSVGEEHQLPPALPLAPEQARLGTSVFTIGFPRVDVMGTTPKLSLGIISGINGLHDNPDSYQISVPIQPGNSGGPLLNMHGEVVGLITSMLGVVDAVTGDPQPLPSVNYALKIDMLEQLLREAPQASGSIKELSSGHYDLETLADKIQRSVMIVRAE
jgi:S1-C subfamily serine protease